MEVSVVISVVVVDELQNIHLVQVDPISCSKGFLSGVSLRSSLSSTYTNIAPMRYVLSPEQIVEELAPVMPKAT